MPPVALLGVIAYGPATAAVAGEPAGLAMVTLPTVSPFCGATGMVNSVPSAAKVCPYILLASLALIVSGAAAMVPAAVLTTTL